MGSSACMRQQGNMCVPFKTANHQHSYSLCTIQPAPYRVITNLQQKKACNIKKLIR